MNEDCVHLFYLSIRINFVKKIMLSEKLALVLNAQIAVECRASYAYLAMASWCEAKGLEGCARFLYLQSDEERAHMLKLYKYINDSGSHALTPVPEPVENHFKSVIDVFEQFLKAEVMVSNAVNELVYTATTEKDYTTLNFLQWYVSEQHEEETLARSIMDKINLIGLESSGLYLIDKEIGALATATVASASAEAQ
jgi:ferritin